MNYSIPKLYKPEKGDWYVHYRVKDPKTGEWKQFKEKEGINRLKTKKEKLHKGAVLVSTYTGLLFN